MSSDYRRELRATRRSLIGRLGNLDDQRSWREFFDAYGGLLYRVARQAGLNDAEAQEAVQETIITVSRQIGNLRYDPAQGSFKGWLLQTARWRITDQFRRRRPETINASADCSANPEAGPRTGLIERIPDSAAGGFEKLWEHEWQENLFAAAAAKVRQRADPRHFQVFDCCVRKGWAASRAARELGMNIAQVYLAKHRIGALMKKAVAEIESGKG
jgi:RNA polymerase sigma factor (sigma-70 family)